MLTQQCHRRLKLCLRNAVGAGKNDGGCGFNLVVIKLTKVLHINLNFTCIRHGDLKAKNNIVIGHLFHSDNHVAEFAYAGGFDHDTVGIVLLNHLS